MLIPNHEHFMKKALNEALIAFEEGEVPIGAIIVSKTGRILGKGHNQVERLNDPTAHAEMIAITAAAETIGAKYLKECTLYVTLEPCVMCAGAISWAQLDHIVFGAKDPKKGFTLQNPPIIHANKNIVSGILENDCSQLIKDFFENLRT